MMTMDSDPYMSTLLCRKYKKEKTKFKILYSSSNIKSVMTNNNSLRANPPARSLGQVKLDSDK